MELAFPVAVGTVGLLAAACIGLGAVVLRSLRILDDFPLVSGVVWSFAVGFGALGWLIFFPAILGILTTPTLLVLCGLGVCGLPVLLRAKMKPPSALRNDTISWFLLAGLAYVLGIDFLEGMSPPADGDTLAFHFALPKWHLAKEMLVAVPRAVDGILPQLVQMTYVAALGIGGEKALVQWTMLSGWMTGALLYDVCRRFIPHNWSLAVALIYLSTPAIIQTGGAGHVEPRIAQFALVAGVAAGIAVYRNNVAYAQLSGLCAGFYAGSKYTGLLFCLAGAVAMLVGVGRWKRIVLFSLFALIGGLQWYLWIWSKTGDPVFPMLYRVLGADPGLWSAALDEAFRQVLNGAESPFDKSLWGFLVYPFYTTFVDVPALENGRTGLGVTAVILAPFAFGWIAFIWKRQGTSPLFISGLIALLFFAFWFFGGSPQRVRHLLPIFTLVLVCLSVAAFRCAERVRLLTPLAAGLGLCILIQMGGQAVYGINYARHVLTSETRDEFLRRNVPLYSLVSWFNGQRNAKDKLLVFHRELLYLVDGDVAMSHGTAQQMYNFVLFADGPEKLYRELLKGGITHILSPGQEDTTVNVGQDATALVPLEPTLRKFFLFSCLRVVHQTSVPRFSSRTLPSLAARESSFALYRLQKEGCSLS